MKGSRVGRGVHVFEKNCLFVWVGQLQLHVSGLLVLFWICSKTTGL